MKTVGRQRKERGRSEYEGEKHRKHGYKRGANKKVKTERKKKRGGRKRTQNWTRASCKTELITICYGPK
jgi:hypothetical protein